jgi:hypothetical protein
VQYYDGGREDFRQPESRMLEITDCAVFSYAGQIAGSLEHAKATLMPRPGSELAKQNIMFVHVAETVAEVYGSPVEQFQPAARKPVSVSKPVRSRSVATAGSGF